MKGTVKREARTLPSKLVENKYILISMIPMVIKKTNPARIRRRPNPNIEALYLLPYLITLIASLRDRVSTNLGRIKVETAREKGAIIRIQRISNIIARGTSGVRKLARISIIIKGRLPTRIIAPMYRNSIIISKNAQPTFLSP
ncbi:142aa long hypothetical protein [Pyrococcus horikoshii OT3]|uniref:Uncharacterized protein n=1 Tax=Pyrococcus horikoshii (strain ATCC 700860 / DSM 12428 / JCM 9974 / NBRC 100139 / OT-3) TaxID=70601 RepID=O58927_PYRHO|nr:142aa long hypothetical protein [Pyrococcus horikoshii OT3]